MAQPTTLDRPARGPGRPKRGEVLLQARGVRQTYAKGAANDLVVLDNIDLELREGEMVALLGRSGSGKSSLLRMIAGLTRPAAGDLLWRGQPLTGPTEGISMVFQTFALFPWLTVLDNVEIGLESLGISPDERRRRSLEAIDLIGLDGFESAFPKELSGGMRQRVGFARGLVMHPDLLLMDEPFSALDVLTAETLRTDLIELWAENRLPIKAVLMVTHSIEEAVLMCDRILLFASNPGRIEHEIKIDLPHPRDRNDARFRRLVDDVYERLTASLESRRRGAATTAMGAGAILPNVSTNLLAGLMEALAGQPFEGKADLPELADELTMEVDDLFPITETLALFAFAEVMRGDIRLTELGRRFVLGDTDQRKRLFSQQLTARVPIAALIRRVLDERPTHRAPRTRFAAELEDFMSEEAAEETLDAVIDWGRYAELFAYDENAGVFSLEDPT